MPDNVKLEGCHQPYNPTDDNHNTATNPTNNQQKPNHHHHTYSPNNSSSASNNTVNGNKTCVDSQLSLSQITETFNDTNSSTSNSQQNSTDPQSQPSSQQVLSGGDKNSNSSISSGNDSSDMIKPNHTEEIATDAEMKFSYIRAIAEAIIETPHHEILLSDLYNKIITKYPELKNKRVDWQNGIRHNLSLNECFVKLDRNPSGKGHYWGIRRCNLEPFLRNDFRRRWSQSRSRCKRPKFNRHNDYIFRGDNQSIQDCFGTDYPESDLSYPTPTYYNNNYNNNNNNYYYHYRHPSHTMAQQPFQLQYFSTSNNGYFVDNFHRDYEQTYNQFYSRHHHHHPLQMVDTRAPSWTIHSRPLPYSHTYFQNRPNHAYVYPPTSHQCNYHLNNNIPYCVDENSQPEAWERVPKERKTDPSVELAASVECAKEVEPTLTSKSSSSPIPSFLSTNAHPSSKCLSKPVFRSYFKNGEVDLRNRGVGPMDVGTNSDMFEADAATTSKFDLNSLLDR